MEPLTFLVLPYCKSVLRLHVCVRAADEVESVKTAVSHGDRTLSEMTLMTLLLKCEARVITVLSLKARAVTAEENTRQSGALWWRGVWEAAGVHGYRA